jgi:hypothetical protein
MLYKSLLQFNSSCFHLVSQWPRYALMSLKKLEPNFSWATYCESVPYNVRNLVYEYDYLSLLCCMYAKYTYILYSYKCTSTMVRKIVGMFLSQLHDFIIHYFCNIAPFKRCVGT